MKVSAPARRGADAQETACPPCDAAEDLLRWRGGAERPRTEPATAALLPVSYCAACDRSRERIASVTLCLGSVTWNGIARSAVPSKNVYVRGVLKRELAG